MSHRLLLAGTALFALAVASPALADDYPSDASTAGTIAAGGIVSGNLEVSGDRDWFAIDLAPGAPVEISLEGAPTGAGSLSDPFLAVYNANGEEIAYNDDSNGTFNSFLLLTVDSAGTYYVSAEAFGSATGTYTLSVTATEPLDDDFAAAIDGAGTVTPGQPATGAIEIGGDEDWFALQVTAGQRYVIDMEGTPTNAGSLPDPYLYLYDDTGAEIDWNDDGGLDFNSRLTFTPDATGTVYIGAAAYAGNVGTYTLTVAETEAPEDDYPATASTTGSVTVGQPVTGEIEVPDDEDWFALQAEAGMSYRIDMEGTPTNAGSLPDPYLYLYDSSGMEVDWNDDGGEAFNSQITFTPDAPGTYYIGAAAFASNTGTYTLTVSEFVPPPDDYASDTGTAGYVSVGSSATGEIEVAYDADWFAVDLEAGVTYVITQEGTPTAMGTLPDPYVAIYDDAGYELDWNDDGGSGFNSRLLYTPSYSGLHFVEGGAYGSNTGTYTIAVEEFVVPEGDVGETPETAGYMNVNEPMYGALDYSGDIDVYAVELTQGVTYTISMEGTPTGAGTLGDPYLYLYDDYFSVIDANDDGGTDFNSLITYTADYSGTYYVGAEAFADGTGTYTLTVSGGAGGNTGGPVGDVVAVEVDLVGGGTLRIEVPRDEIDGIETIRIRP
ncbi:MAG: PPC domain-containing protein [Rhodospirillaceae bacterium]|nr:PPC domain-containing protein [Rhodospirillaceae bacterium]